MKYRGSLGTVTQSLLDAWVAELPGTCPALRAFVQWSAAHGYMARGLEVPWRASREDRHGMNDEERITLAGRWLRAETADPPARLGAVGGKARFEERIEVAAHGRPGTNPSFTSSSATPAER